MFFIGYYNVMKSVFKPLDILRLEARAYMAILLPVVAMCLKNLQELNAINVGHTQLRLPLVRPLTSGIMTRFQSCFNSLDAALHSFYKLFWLIWLEENEFGCDIEVTKKELYRNQFLWLTKVKAVLTYQIQAAATLVCILPITMK